MVRPTGVSSRRCSLSPRHVGIRHRIGYSGNAAIPEAEALGASPLRRIVEPFRLSLIGSSYLSTAKYGGSRRTTRDFTGQLVSHCVRATPPVTLAVHVRSPSTRTRARIYDAITGCVFLQCFVRLGSLAHRPGRNVTPPGLSSPGPFAAARHQATLATYPRRL